MIALWKAFHYCLFTIFFIYIDNMCREIYFPVNLNNNRTFLTFGLESYFSNHEYCDRRSNCSLRSGIGKPSTNAHKIQYS